MTYQPTPEEIRHRRDRYLQISDIYVMSDRWDLYSSDQKSSWSTYRQELRDIPNQPGWPTVLTWPQPPITITLDTPEGWPPEWS